MAVVVGKNENDVLEIKNSNRFELPTKQEEKEAKEVDAQIQKILEKEFKNINETRTNSSLVDYYWTLGQIIKNVFDSIQNFKKEDKKLLYENIRFRLEKYDDSLPQDDPKRNRFILMQFEKLASYDNENANRLNWSEWSYLFDNSMIIQNTDFDSWFNEKLSQTNIDFDEGFARVWAMLFNRIFKNIEIEFIDKNRFNSILDFTFELISQLKTKGLLKNRNSRKELKAKLFSLIDTTDGLLYQIQTNDIKVKQIVKKLGYS